MSQKRARFALEDGTVLRGTAVGAEGESIGEVVFNTSLTGYQEIFKRQVALFEETMGSLQLQASEMKMDQLSAEGAQRQVELMKAGYEKALDSLNELAETAQKANTQAFEILRARIEASIEELKAMSATKA